MSEAEQRQRPTEESPRVNGNVPKPIDLCDFARALETNAQSHHENGAPSTNQNVQTQNKHSHGDSLGRNVWHKMGLNKARSGGENGTVVESKDHNRIRLERETLYEATQGILKEAKIPENAVKPPTKSNDHRPRVADASPSSSIGHDNNYTANIEANGTANDKMHGPKAVRPMEPSVSSPTAPQSLEPTKQRGQIDAPGPSSAQRDDAPNVEDFNTLNVIAEPIDSETPQSPANIVSKDTIPKDTIGSYLSDAHPVTGEPALEVTQIEKKSRFFSLNNSPLKIWRSKAKQMLPLTRCKGNLSGIDVDEVDGLKITTNVPITAIDNNNFEWYIREKLAALICTIPPKGLEKQSSTLQELEMIVNENDQLIPCIVIACASQSRKADVKKKLDSELPHFELYGLWWVVIYDLERSGYLAHSAAESNEELAPTAQPGYVAATTLNEATDRNNWDRYISAPLYLFPILPNDEATDAPGYALCTLGGFIQVADGIYGLTVAHPLLNAITRSSAQAPRLQSGQKSKDFVVGNVIACVLSNVSSDNRAGKQEQGSAPPNSDWALIELGEGFGKAQLDEGQLAANFTPVEKEKLEVIKDADLEPRTVLIRTGFSSDVKGKLSIAKSSLQIGSALFTAMRITLNEPLVPGDSGSFVFLDGKVCGTIIAGRDSLKRAYMIPITDTFRSISSEFGGAPVRFPEGGVIQAAKSPSSPPQQNDSSGQVTSRKKTTSPVNTRDEIPSDLEIPTLANPKLMVRPPSSMPEGSYKINIHEPKDIGISRSGTPSNPKTKTQPMEERILQEGSSDFLPLSYTFVNSPPSMKDILPKSVIPGVRNPLINAQGGTSIDYLRAERVRSVENVNNVIEKRANVNNVEYAEALLRQAAEEGRVERVKLLLEKGADVNAADVFRWTPLCWASVSGHVEVVKLLLEKGADVNAADGLRRTPLCWASQKGHVEVVKLLLEKGADVNTADTPGWTPLRLASEKGHVEVVKLLAAAQEGD